MPVGPACEFRGPPPEQPPPPPPPPLPPPEDDSAARTISKSHSASGFAPNDFHGVVRPSTSRTRARQWRGPRVSPLRVAAAVEPGATGALLAVGTSPEKEVPVA